MNTEAFAEPDWLADEAESLSEEPMDWASDYPISSDEGAAWVDAYEL